MSDITKLIEQNQSWGETILKERPHFFKEGAQGQSPQYLWLGCSDSRVPETSLLGLEPGDIFVHRNIANQAPHDDLSFSCVLEYAVHALKVQDIIVCGHTGCGGVLAALDTKSYGGLDPWLAKIKEISCEKNDRLEKLTEEEKAGLMYKYNVQKQVLNIAHSSIIKRAWEQKQKLSIHGLLYHLETGKLEDLSLRIDSYEQVDTIRAAL